jgi:hemerythrin
MQFIVWTDFFSTGINYIDRQHKKLIDIANDFHSSVKNNANKSTMFSILNHLVSYAEEHFADEEKIMQKAGVPAEHFEYHKELHEKLTLSVFDLNAALERGESKTIDEIEVFLNDWLIKHILEEDRKMLPYSARLKNYNPTMS